MIVSVSRRTDIPAFYSQWFFNRLDEGYVYVRNPMNPKQVSRILLNRDTVDCFVFWTKNPQPMMKYLSILDALGYPYYFQFTMTPYGQDVEPGLPDKKVLEETFKCLSEHIGPERVIWRYDPLLLSSTYTKEFHYEYFEKMCRSLEGYTNRCVISFLDGYGKIKRNMGKLGILDMKKEDAEELASHIGPMAVKHNMVVSTCSEAADFSAFHIKKGKCIDDRLISGILGKSLKVKKDDTQRDFCGCVKSVDIGTYNTCGHYCRYCYANASPDQVRVNISRHNPCSDLLVGNLNGDEKITEREMKSVAAECDEQMELQFGLF